MARLPVRTGADVHLADAFAEPGCPLCRERARTDAAYLESILSESVNDVAFRRALDDARGFCGRHARAMLDADRRRSGSLGAAILLRATLVARLRDLDAAHGARGWGRTRRVADAARPPDCPACARDAVADAGRVESLVLLTADPAWAAAVAAAPLCLDHVTALMGVRPASKGWEAVETAQLARLAALRDDLDAFAHSSSHDRRHRQTDVMRGAPDRAAALLAGGVPDLAVATGARAVLLTGVYGAGKTTAAVEIAGRLEAAGVAMAVIDLDWLGWHTAPVAWDEHEDPRLTLENLAAMRAAYLRVGVVRFVLAGTVRGAGRLDRLRAVLEMPVEVVRLEVRSPSSRRALPVTRTRRVPTTSRSRSRTSAAPPTARPWTSSWTATGRLPPSRTRCSPTWAGSRDRRSRPGRDPRPPAAGTVA